MVQIRFTRRFSMAHRLLAERTSKCAVPHGHNEFVSVVLAPRAGSKADAHWGQSNYTASFESLKKPWHAFVDDALDHAFQLGADDPLIGYFKAHEPDLLPRLLIIPGDPTTEAVGLALLAKLNAFLGLHNPDFEVLRLELEETPTNTVIVTPADLAACPIDFGAWTHRADLSINDLLPPGAFGGTR
jgi:6-pyruvoyltetrahydropterin/6-carboxytetrahydropterin synthase